MDPWLALAYVINLVARQHVCLGDGKTVAAMAQEALVCLGQTGQHEVRIKNLVCIHGPHTKEGMASEDYDEMLGKVGELAQGKLVQNWETLADFCHLMSQSILKVEEAAKSDANRMSERPHAPTQTK